MFTQIGSLPYLDIRAAVNYSLLHAIPFLPELPGKGDSMLSYIKHPGNVSCLNEFKKNTFEQVKIQCVGPVTLLASGYSEDEALTSIYEHISVIMDGLQAQQVILFLDEPGLGQVGFEFETLWSAIFGAFDVVSGIHVCGNADWDRLFLSDIDMISFDASKFDITIFSKYRNQKRIAWGVENKRDIKDFQKGDLLTLPCGMSPTIYSVEDCQEKFSRLNLLAQKQNV